VIVVSPGSQARDVEPAIRRLRPDVLHFYHAYKTGRLLPSLDSIPSVLTVSGTDLNIDYENPEHRGAVDRALARASAIVTYSPSLARRAPVAIVIPKGVTLGEEPYDLRLSAEVRKEAFVFFQAGAIRPVKNNLAAIDGLSPLKKEAALVLAGRVLDAEYGHRLANRLVREPWVRHIPLIPPDAMAAAYRGCEVVVNSSLSEGLSNTLAEAMACGCAILASAIPGNRDFLEHGVTAALYKDAHDLTDLAAWLIRDSAAREKLGAAARAYAREHFSTDREAEALLAAYSRACGR
jgi:glycosyltransferase involved in cell wall biosynthesis